MSDRPSIGLAAEFAAPEALVAAAVGLRRQGFPASDALLPYHIEGVAEALDLPQSTIRWPMLIAGLAAAALAYGIETWSAVFSYPINSGGRPLNSWPVFVLVPFEFGVLIAAAAGLVAFLLLCGLPRLNHPAFEIAGVDRATSDRFFLLFPPLGESEERRLMELLRDAHAIRVEGARH